MKPRRRRNEQKNCSGCPHGSPINRHGKRVSWTDIPYRVSIGNGAERDFLFAEEAAAAAAAVVAPVAVG